jgi:hypothetical protein
MLVDLFSRPAAVDDQGRTRHKGDFLIQAKHSSFLSFVSRYGTLPAWWPTTHRALASPAVPASARSRSTTRASSGLRPSSPYRHRNRRHVLKISEELFAVTKNAVVAHIASRDHRQHFGPDSGVQALVSFDLVWLQAYDLSKSAHT